MISRPRHYSSISLFLLVPATLAVVCIIVVSFVWVIRRNSLGSESQTLAALQVPQSSQAAPAGQAPTADSTLLPVSGPGANMVPLPSSPGIPTRAPAYVLASMTPVTVDSSFDIPNPGPTVYATPQPTLGPDQPWGGGIYAYRHPNTKVSTAESEIIITGVVKLVGPSRWTTVDAKRPVNPHAASNKDTIFRPVLVGVDTYVKGSIKQPELQIMAFGGSVGQDTVEWSGDDLYTFKEGQRVILFLNRGGDMSRIQANTRLPLWQVVEHYTVQTDGNASNSYETLPVTRLLKDIKSASDVTRP